MKQRRKAQTNVEVSLSFNYSITQIVPNVPGYLDVPQGYKTTPVGVEDLPMSKRSSDATVRYSQSVELDDPRFEETYIAYITRTFNGWSGRIPDVPKFNRCQATSKNALLEVLKDNLYQALVAEGEAWDDQLEEDAENGFLDRLSERAVQNYQTGRYYDLETPKKKL